MRRRSDWSVWEGNGSVRVGRRSGRLLDGNVGVVVGGQPRMYDWACFRGAEWLYGRVGWEYASGGVHASGGPVEEGWVSCGRNHGLRTLARRVGKG